MQVQKSSSLEGAAHLRNVALLPGEKVTHLFSPEAGLAPGGPLEGPPEASPEAPKEESLLVTTNQRIISFTQANGQNETFLLPIEELKAVTVKSARTSVNLAQGLLLAFGGLIAYVIMAYWLTGQVDGPNVPVINIDLVPMLTLMAIVWGAVLIARFYFDKDDSLIKFEGGNWDFSFPFRGQKAEGDIYQLVNTVFSQRQSRNGHYPFLWDE